MSKVENMAIEIVLERFNKDLFNIFMTDCVRQYKGRLIFESPRHTARFIDLIDKLNAEFGLTGDYVTKVLIDEYDFIEFDEGEDL